LARRPRTWFWAWQSLTQFVGGLATSVASSPVTKPIRPPLATSQTDMAPQWATLGVRGSAVLQSGCGTRVATWALSRTTNFGERSLPMLTRGVTATQNCPGGPVSTLVQPEPRKSPIRARKFGLSK
jgi:hypothetical protein